MAARGVRAMVVRLSPSVHGDGDHGFVPILVRAARERGFAMYVGDGSNRWAAVHRFDAARIYRLALERGVAGARYHGVGDEGVPVRAIVDVIARRLNVPAVAKTPEEAAAMVPFVGRFLALDLASSSAVTQERLGWRPTGPRLITDLEGGRYFDVWSRCAASARGRRPTVSGRRSAADRVRSAAPLLQSRADLRSRSHQARCATLSGLRIEYSAEIE